MDTGEALTLYIVISIIVSLTINILFYRLVFRKQKRVKANTFTWLANLGIMALVNLALIFPFTTNISAGSVGGAIGFGLLMPFVIAPIFWFFPASVFSLIRIIFIVITRNRKREILQDDIVKADLHVDEAYAAKEPE